MPKIKLGGQAIEFRLRQSKRAKRLSIRFIPQSGFEVVYPMGKTKSEALAFLEEQQRWVLKTWSEAQAEANNLTRGRHYVDGVELPYFGESITFRLRASGEKADYKYSKDQLELTLPKRFHADQRLLRNIVEDFYRLQAKRYLPARTWELAQLHGFHYNRVRIKNQKTRWGSCSAKRNINLNLRLMMAPDGAIDYVIIHELCHLRELNHSPAFWTLVEAYCPDFLRWKDWFKQYGPSLIL
ncbi:MAG: SprT family zinc-dependent metalloprotease [Chloroflexota bacterium]|nr:SprT family zinc-dependent metalloprotease [Chloroflexota bacterium]